MSDIRTAIGLMSGTSMDGIDVALLKTDGEDFVEFGPTLAIDYPQSSRTMIEQGLADALEIDTADKRSQRPGSLKVLEKDSTGWHADAVNQFLKINNLAPESIHLIGFHGQTVLHRPDDALTVQLGDGDALARHTGIDIIYDMRAADMVAGGQGAPLVPVFHRALCQNIKAESPVCFVNIGGISNISYVDGDTLLAFDSGPGNALIDQWVQSAGGIPFDQGGRIASEGRVLAPVVDRYLNTPFFRKAGPKSLDRNDFPPLNADDAELSDGARTLAHITAASIIKSTDHLPKPPKTWIVCGGGRLNDAIMTDLSMLAKHQGGTVLASEDVNLQGDMLEAQAFAYLAVRSRKCLPLTFPGTTGCGSPIVGGVLASRPKT